jgi:hypothetical protein
MPRILLCLAFAASLLCGCSNSNPNAPSKLTGRVTYNGAAVTAGNMTFYPKDGGVYTASLDSDGKFLATDLPASESTVTIETESFNPAKKTPTYGGKSGKDQMYTPPGVQPQQNAGTYVKIPPKYADKKTSDLTVTLVRGNQSKDFELKD